jgi:hypothetical protein
VKIGTVSELLTCKPILELARVEESKAAIVDKVQAAILKCASSLGIELLPDQIKMLCSDILEVYAYESVEDILFCLKQARQGAYADIQNYGKLNMIIFRQWMARHLDKKYAEKEKQIESAKQVEKEELTRDEFYERGIKLREELQKIADGKRVSDENYHRERTKYFASKLNDPA